MLKDIMKNYIIEALKSEAAEKSFYWGSVDCFDDYEDLTEDLYRWFKSEGLTIDCINPAKEYNRVEFQVNWKLEESEENTLRHELINISQDNLVYVFGKLRKDIKSWLNSAKSRKVEVESISLSIEGIKDSTLLASKIKRYMEHLFYTDFSIKIYDEELILNVRFG